MQLLQRLDAGVGTRTGYTSTTRSTDGSKTGVEPLAGKSLGILRSQRLMMRSMSRELNTAENNLAADIHGRDKTLIGPVSAPRTALRELLRRPWFQRLWILQEVVVGKKLEMVCGSLKFGWDSLIEATLVLEAYDELAELQTPGRNAFLQFSRTRASYTSGQNLEYLPLLLGPARLLRCSEPRDRIYAISGIARNLEHQSAPKDYSLPIETIYVHTALDIIRDTKSLQIFSAVEECTDLVLPSWTPDWRMNLNYPPLDDPQQAKFWTSQNRYHRFEDSFNLGQLIAYGKIVDVVETIFDHAFEDLDYELASLQQILPILEIDKVLRNHAEINAIALYLSDRDMKQSLTAILRTAGADGLLRGFTGDGEAPQPYLDSELLTFLESWLDVPVSECETIEDNLLVREMREYVKEDMRRMIRTCRYRRFIFPKMYRLGLAPRHTERGDVICILHGSNVPCILRPVHGREYRLVGQCYIDGIMYGEAIKWDESDAEVFILV